MQRIARDREQAHPSSAALGSGHDGYTGYADLAAMQKSMNKRSPLFTLFNNDLVRIQLVMILSLLIQASFDDKIQTSSIQLRYPSRLHSLTQISRTRPSCCPPYLRFQLSMMCSDLLVYGWSLTRPKNCLAQ